MPHPPTPKTYRCEKNKNSEERARELADTIGGDALSLADLETFHPEGGMILANTTSIGMHPKIEETPISKVWHLTAFA